MPPELSLRAKSRSISAAWVWSARTLTPTCTLILKRRNRLYVPRRADDEPNNSAQQRGSPPAANLEPSPLGERGAKQVQNNHPRRLEKRSSRQALHHRLLAALGCAKVLRSP